MLYAILIFIEPYQVQDVMRDERGFDLVIAEAFIEEAVYAFAEHFHVS
jgi:hypothetical protein